MSAIACIAFYGMRFELPAESIEKLLEDEVDPRIEAATKVKLDVYWANFGGADERYLLFIGRKLGILGPENDHEEAIPSNQLRELIASTADRLLSIGIEGDPQIYIQWEEDV
jgi:hypothetical protein